MPIWLDNPDSIEDYDEYFDHEDNVVDDSNDYDMIQDDYIPESDQEY